MFPFLKQNDNENYLLKGERITFLESATISSQTLILIRSFIIAKIWKDFGRFLNLGDILGCPNYYWKPRGRGTSCSIIFTGAMTFKLLDQFENVIPVWECVEIKFHSVSCWNNLERLCFNLTSY